MNRRFSAANLLLHYHRCCAVLGQNNQKYIPTHPLHLTNFLLLTAASAYMLHTSPSLRGCTNNYKEKKNLFSVSTQSAVRSTEQLKAINLTEFS